ncbi:uncharacterized protein EV420DRAFT_1672520, partial [Desarmillaria tabescens]
ARSLYRWLLYNLTHSNIQNPHNIIYTPAHTDSTSMPSQINNVADNLTTCAQTTLLRPPPAPVPIFSMDHFVLYNFVDGYIESNIPSYVSSAFTTDTVAHVNFCPATTMLLPLYDDYAPPEHPYIRASSVYSAVVQLYARSAQLDCTYTRFLRFGDMSPLCHAGCNELETVHHVFVGCPSFNHLRYEA